LNLSQNKLERLPSNEEKSCFPIKSDKHRTQTEAVGYKAPVLEEIHLQFNRLEQIPEEIFQLPSLVSLDVSNNKLQSLPYLMWRSAKLKELNASFNLLRELPTHQQGITVGIDVTSLSSDQLMIRSDSFSSQSSLGVGFLSKRFSYCH
jgi:Leucine-rich repeat (LRR) protein